MSNNPAPIRVIHLISSRGLYGAERVIINLIAAADQCRVIPSLALLKPNDCLPEKFIESVKEKNAAVYIVPYKKWIDTESIRQLISLVRSESVDIVHCHGMKARLYGLFLSAITRVKIITTHHNWVKSDFRVALFEAFDACYIRFFPQIIAVSPEIKETMLKWMIPSKKIKIIINGIDTNEFQRNVFVREEMCNKLGVDKKMKLIGAVGRVSPEKGQKYFIEAATHILKIFPETCFLIIGDGPQEEDLKIYCSNAGISHKVIFPGFIKNIIELYSILDIFVLPSIIEGTPMVLLEAMSCGVPVVATRVGNVPNIINNNKEGLLVEPKNTADLANAIIKLLNSKEYSSLMSENARKKVNEYYSSEIMSSEYLTVYSQILSSSRSAH